jgi:hypothetical protein
LIFFRRLPPWVNPMKVFLANHQLLISKIKR